MDYLTMKQVAELKGCSFQYVHKLIKNGKIKAEQKENPQNKGMCYMIPVSALSEDLQAKYYKQKRTETGVLPELKKGDLLPPPMLTHRGGGFSLNDTSVPSINELTP